MNGIMNEESLENPLSGKGPGVKGVKVQTTEGTDNEPETITVAESPALASRDCGDEKESSPSVAVELSIRETNQGAVAGASEPPVDWFEPLEEDDDGDSWDYVPSEKHNGKRDAEEESLAGESEKSGSVAGSEKAYRRIYRYPRPNSRRKRANNDEGWVEWPDLGQGWKRKEVVRSSGSSVGKTDVYYLGPNGERVRSKVELVTVLEGILDVTMFEFKTGKFSDHVPVQRRGRRKIRDHSSSESSWLERGDGAETPDSHQWLTPSAGNKLVPSNQKSLSLTVSMDHAYKMKEEEEEAASAEHNRTVPLTTVPLPSIGGHNVSEGPTLICAQCGVSFIGTWYDKQRKRPCCPRCWDLKAKEHPMIRFRKVFSPGEAENQLWFPCGQCVACRNTVNCGQCASCRHALQNPGTRKRVCRKRKCLCPLRKMRDPVVEQNTEKRPQEDEPETVEPSVSLKWNKRRKRRTCGKCSGCLVKRDCGTCDFCSDKPKFGGRNTKRQKCRLRQCQKQSLMRYTYSRNAARESTQQSSFEVSDEDGDCILHAVSQSSFGVADKDGDCNLHAVSQSSFGVADEDGDCNLHAVSQSSFGVADIEDGDHELQASEVVETQQNPSYQNSDTEDFSVNMDEIDEEDMSTDDDDDWHKKRKRRTCGSCEGCLVPRDCGTCDFCADKPKFGGSNKKRQKCRLRQCQRQAMRHLLPLQLASAEYQESLVQPGRPRPLYTYSRKTAKKSRHSSMEAADGEDGNDKLQTMNWNLEPTNSKHVYEMNYGNCRSPIQNQLSRRSVDWTTDRDVENPTAEEDDELPMITRIFSLAPDSASIAPDTDSGLVKLLGSLRNSVMPIIWFAIMAEGPQLQLVQCCKRSNMADTMVEIHPGFTYQVTVQKQPLLPTHPLYHDHPPRLSTAVEVVSLLLDLETYEVCQGMPPSKQRANNGPIIFERAATCDFLIQKNVKSCDNCRALYE